MLLLVVGVLVMLVVGVLAGRQKKKTAERGRSGRGLAQGEQKANMALCVGA